MNNREMADKEYNELINWVFSEEKKVMEEIKQDKNYRPGLDGYEDRFKYIYDYRNKRIKEIKEKYQSGTY